MEYRTGELAWVLAARPGPTLPRTGPRGLGDCPEITLLFLALHGPLENLVCLHGVKTLDSGLLIENLGMG